ncbi:unnamed protein product [Mytilus edulis]|uniref:Ig-like domain-containing protein n=1 Tax=Mytilus edulis TaxID=6550 RepID=A0A8S3SPX9_MYTED|nr:unnamed protein product [Mytilus edulis]
MRVKPVLILFDPDTLYTEETKSVDVSCQSTGSRPAASMYWLLGQQNITSDSTSQTIHDSPTDKYTVTSSLRYSVDRRYNGQKLTCGAVNIAGSMETFLTLDVKYAPGVIVENKTFSLTQSHRQIDSTLDSNPSINICTWQHKSTYGEIIRDFSDNNQTLTLPTVSENNRYQDTGEYVCIAENGNKQLVSSKYVIKEDPAIVKDLFHGVEVQLDGYTVKLAISDLQESDFTNYTLRVYYGSHYVQHDVTLESASKL